MKNIVFTSVLFVFLVGCTKVPPLNFMPEESAITTNGQQSLNAELRSITVSAAKPNEQVGAIQVGSAGIRAYEGNFREAFKSALEETIIRSLLFKDDAERKVSLSAKVLQLESPHMGFNFTTDVVVRYQIIDRSTGGVLYERDIQSVGEVPVGYAFVGATRQTEARNRAMQSNIANFVNDLRRSKLK